MTTGETVLADTRVRVRVLWRTEQPIEWMREHLLQRIVAGEPQLDPDTLDNETYEWSKNEAVTRYEADFRLRTAT